MTLPKEGTRKLPHVVLYTNAPAESVMGHTGRDLSAATGNADSAVSGQFDGLLLGRSLAGWYWSKRFTQDVHCDSTHEGQTFESIESGSFHTFIYIQLIFRQTKDPVRQALEPILITE
jgi:hypothetical protein